VLRGLRLELGRPTDEGDERDVDEQHVVGAVLTSRAGIAFDVLTS
jgi:hypothetical protein